MQLLRDIAATQLGGDNRGPFRLEILEHITVPLVKIPILACGNYRCILSDNIWLIREAVWGDLGPGRKIYHRCTSILIAHDIPSSQLVVNGCDWL